MSNIGRWFEKARKTAGEDARAGKKPKKKSPEKKLGYDAQVAKHKRLVKNIRARDAVIAATQKRKKPSETFVKAVKKSDLPESEREYIQGKKYSMKKRTKGK